ncbi:hypothetical protein BJX64DRAFT_92427 [Aspergillus heterothallicus]
MLAKIRKASGSSSGSLTTGLGWVLIVSQVKLDKEHPRVARRTENALMDPVCKVANTQCNRLKRAVFDYTLGNRSNTGEAGNNDVTS